VINFIDSNLSLSEKISKYAEYLQIPLQSIDDSIEDKFADTLRKMTSAKYTLELKMDDLLTAIDEISKSSTNCENINILYDSDMNKLNVYDGQWNESIVGKGLRLIIEKLQENYFDHYEQFIIHKYHEASNGFFQQVQKERLDEYYTFIATFDLQPFCQGRSDSELVKNGSTGTYTLSDKLTERFMECKKQVRNAYRTKIHSLVLDIIKRNSAKTVKNLNTNIYDLFCKDTGFKEFLENAEKNNIVAM
jgi:hypothetical protein